MKILDCIRRCYRLQPKFSLADAKEKDLLRLGEAIKASSYKEWTKRDTFIVIRKYYRVMEGRNAHYPKKLDYFRPTPKPGPVKGPGDIISHQELEAMLSVTRTSRDRAILMLLYEGGLRVGELCNLQVADVVVADDGLEVHISDAPGNKTGARDIWLTESIGALQEYKATLNRQGSLFKMNAYSVRMQLHKLAIRAHLNPGRIHPHAWRHTCATEKALLGFSEAQLNAFMGWQQGSATSAYYIHLSKRGVKEAYQRALGLKIEGRELSGKRCPKCGYENSPRLDRCARCYTNLDIKKRMEDMEEKHRRDQQLATLAKKIEDLEKRGF